MVAVKNLWVLWKSFSTNFSFSSSGSSGSSSSNNSTSYRNNEKNGNNDSKHVKYNRLRAVGKSESSFLPKSTSRTSFNCLTKSSSSSYQTDSNGNHWKSTLEDSDSEYEDNNHDFFMSITPDEFSDYEDEDEALTCDVCDRSFSTAKRLADHQQKKRHYGCLQCDSIFPSKQALDHHRQEMDHYDYVSDYESETTSFDSDDNTAGFEDHDEEERERLL